MVDKISTQKLEQLIWNCTTTENALVFDLENDVSLREMIDSELFSSPQLATSSQISICARQWFQHCKCVTVSVNLLLIQSRVTELTMLLSSSKQHEHVKWQLGESRTVNGVVISCSDVVERDEEFIYKLKIPSTLSLPQVCNFLEMPNSLNLLTGVVACMDREMISVDGAFHTHESIVADIGQLQNRWRWMRAVVYR